MIPSNQRLLRGAQEALQAAIYEDLRPDSAAALASVKTLLGELVLRHDEAFCASYCAEGSTLAQEGSALLRGRIDNDGIGRTLAVAVERASNTGVATTGRIDAIQKVLTHLVTELAPWASAGPVGDFLSRVVDWENKLYSERARGGSAQEHAAQASPDLFSVEAIERYLRLRFPDGLVPRVSGLRKLTGGFSKSTLIFDAAYSSTPGRTLVIRAEQPMSLVLLEGAKIQNEYFVLCLAREAGIPVAEPLWLENDSQHFGVNFLVSAKAAGRNVGTAVGLTETFSDSLLTDMVQNLFQIHKTSVDADDGNVRSSHLGRWLRFGTLTESNRQNVAYWREIITSMALPPSPIVARALEWLERNIPVCEEAPSLVHRDYGGHNILVENDRVACILDWESATIGDPAEDLAWMTNCMKGQVARERILDLYAEISGRPAPIERVRFFDVLTSLKYAVTCLQALSLYDKQPGAPANFCQLGLMYMHHGTGDLNHCIEVAEAAQRGERFVI